MTNSKDDFNDDDFFESELEGLGEDLQSLDEAGIKYPAETTPAYASTSEPVEEVGATSDPFLDTFDSAVESDSAGTSEDDDFFDNFENSDVETPVVDGVGVGEEEEHGAAQAEENVTHEGPEQSGSALLEGTGSSFEPPLLEEEQEPIIEFDVQDSEDGDAKDDAYDRFVDEEIASAARKEFDTKKAAFIAVPIIVIVVVFGVFLKYQQMVGGKARQPQASQAQFVPESSGTPQRQQPTQQSQTPSSNHAEIQTAAPQPQSDQVAESIQGAGSSIQNDLFAPVTPVDEKVSTQAAASREEVESEVAVGDIDTPAIPEESGAFSSSFYERLGDPRVQFNAKKVVVESGGESISVKRTVTQEGDLPMEKPSAVDAVDKGLGGATEWLKVQFAAVREDMVAINTKLDQAADERESLRDGLEGLSRRVSELEGRDVVSQNAQPQNHLPDHPQSYSNANLRIIGAMNGKAWVLVGEEVVARTIIPGDVVPGFGEVVEISADACAVRFASGKKVCE